MPYYWRIEVLEPGDPARGISRYVQRFTFTNQTDAWHCYAQALHNGFKVSAERVRDWKASTPTGGRTA